MTTKSAAAALNAYRTEMSAFFHGPAVKGKRAKYAAMEAKHQELQNAWLVARAAK